MNRIGAVVVFVRLGLLMVALMLASEKAVPFMFVTAAWIWSFSIVVFDVFLVIVLWAGDDVLGLFVDKLEEEKSSNWSGKGKHWVEPNEFQCFTKIVKPRSDLNSNSKRGVKHSSISWNSSLRVTADNGSSSNVGSWENKALNGFNFRNNCLRFSLWQIKECEAEGSDYFLNNSS